MTVGEFCQRNGIVEIARVVGIDGNGCLGCEINSIVYRFIKCRCLFTCALNRGFWKILFQLELAHN